MAVTKLKLKQIESSATPGSFVAYDASNVLTLLAPTAGADRIPFYDDSATAGGFLTLGPTLSISGTTLNASAGAGGYTEIQEEGTPVTTQTKINFVGSGLTATNDGVNSRTNVTVATFLNTLATAGAVSLTSHVSGTLPVANGGTGITSGTSGGVLYYSGSGVLASSGALTDNVIVLGGGAGSAPTPLAAGLGTTTTVLHGNAAGEPTWAAVSLTADVSGTLPATNGGTGFASYAVGDLLYANTTTTLAKLADVATGSVLKSGGVSTAPSWGTLASTDLSNSANIALLNATQTFTGTNTFSNNITMNGTPSANTDVITVGYLANFVANGLKYHSVRGATIAALSVSARTSTTLTVGGTSLVLDGVTYANGDYILVKNDTSGSGAGAPDNGAYVVSGVGSSIVLTRASYMDTAGEVDGNTFVVEDGTANAGTLWLTISEVSTIGVNSIVFSQIQTGGTVVSVTVTQPAAGITITNSGSAQTGATTSTLSLANDLAALEGLASTGFAVRTGTDTWAQRTLQGTTNRISITANAAGVAGDPTIDISSAYVGQTSITTLGTITTGTWTGTAIAGVNGGTGQTTTALGDLLVGAASNTWSKLAIGTTGYVLKSNGTTATWAADSTTVTRAYVTGSTSTTFVLNTGTPVTDVDGTAINFTVPSNVDLVFVVRNGQTLSRSGTVSRDYTLSGQTLTLATALTTDENLLIYKIGG